MSDFFIEIIRYLLAPSILLAVIAGFCLHYGQKYERLLAAVLAGGGLFFSLGIYTAKRLQPKKLLKTLTRLNRQLLAAAFILLLLAIIVFVIFILFARRARAEGDEKKAFSKVLGSLFIILSSLAFGAILASSLPFVLLKTKEFVAFGEDSFGTSSLFRVGGYLSGALVLFMLGLSLFQLYRRLSKAPFNLFALLILLALDFDYALKGISALARLHILKSSNDLVFRVMILDDKSLGLNAFIYLAVISMTALYVYFTHRHLKGEFATPARRRKARWWLRNCRRWSVSAVVFILISYLAVTVLLAYVSRPVVLTPPQEYQETKDLIIIPLEDVDDGHLHRFSYEFEGHDIRFIIVKKPQGSAYGVGLDACDICGVAGYYERNDDVICKRCDVVMNKATIGFKGGCNPVPFNYDLKDGQIIIEKTVLEAEKNRFPIGR
ncbi:MAG: Fe-S-containing protein [Eubacteriales bacterium]|nr:Fe-S-containing protein [Eubacteriales bacterium]